MVLTEYLPDTVIVSTNEFFLYIEEQELNTLLKYMNGNEEYTVLIVDSIVITRNNASDIISTIQKMIESRALALKDGKVIDLEETKERLISYANNTFGTN